MVQCGARQRAISQQQPQACEIGMLGGMIERLGIVGARSGVEQSASERWIVVQTGRCVQDLARAKPLFDQDFDRFRQFFTAQAVGRNVVAAMMLRSDGSVIVKADIRLPPELPEPPLPPIDSLKVIGDTEAVSGIVGDTNYAGALIKLKGYDNAYLFIAHSLDPTVWASIQQANRNLQGYTALEARRSSVQLGYALMYTVIAFAVLLSAVWIGFAFVRPISLSLQ
jgi:two-component system nitrogen regulation sensor histidine kinase NtrY